MGNSNKSHHSIADDKTYLMVAALDFGTTFSGYAFSMRGSPEEIRINDNWGASLGFLSHKTPTSVLTDNKGKFLDMGFDAEKKYAESRSETSKHLHLYRHFKMTLHESKNVSIASNVKSEDNKISSAITIFGYAIEYLRKHLLEEIERKIAITPSSGEILWVITVPAIWGEPSKKFMRAAAKKGGCIQSESDSNLILALEPEAASLCCRRLNYCRQNGYCFPEGTMYIILDCGGGTVDVTAHKVLNNEKVEEVVAASGGPWGGKNVDEEFIRLLESIFGANFIDTFRKDHPGAWLDLMSSFETVKKAFKVNSKLCIKLPHVFVNDESFVLQQIKMFGNADLSINNGALIVEYPQAKQLFDQKIQKIVNHVKSILSISKLNEVKYIFMVGGYSECHLLQDVIKENFENTDLKVLIPIDCQLAVLKGAVLFGHFPHEITSRISRVTFGHGISEPFDPKIHSLAKEYLNEHGEARCGGIFSPIVKVGESLELGKVITCETHPSSAASTNTLFQFYSMNSLPDTPIQYIDEGEIKYIGKLTIQHRAARNRRENTMKCIYMFGGTEILIRVIHKKTGEEVRASLDLLSQSIDFLRSYVL